MIDDIPHKGDIAPFAPESAMELYTLGLGTDILGRYSARMAISVTRDIPIFLYSDITGVPAGHSYFSTTFKRHISEGDRPSFFFVPPILPATAIDTVIIAPDPIELLSYAQLNPGIPDTALLIAPHPYCKLKRFGILGRTFANADFHSIYPLHKGRDILNNICIEMALSEKESSITVDSGTLTVSVGRSEYSAELDSIDAAFYDRVLRHDKRKVRILTPPRPFVSYNDIINR